MSVFLSQSGVEVDLATSNQAEKSTPDADRPLGMQTVNVNTHDKSIQKEDIEVLE